MAYDQEFANRVRELLGAEPSLTKNANARQARVPDQRPDGGRGGLLPCVDPARQ